jgi:hypothetical protein
VNRFAAVATRHCPPPSGWVQFRIQAPYVGTSVGNKRPFVSVIDLRVRFQKRNTVLQFIDAAVNGVPVAVMMPVELPKLAGRRRQSAGREKQRARQENHTTVCHTLSRLSGADHSRNGPPKEDVGNPDERIQPFVLNAP